MKTLLLIAVAAGLLPAQPAAEWRDAGQYFNWNSGARELKIFYVCAGDAAKPSVLLVHGFPTSSFDFHSLLKVLQTDYRVCTLDFPGYGLSDKPHDGYKYSLRADAELLRYFVANVAKFSSFAMVSHDRGDSVALNLIQLGQPGITHFFLTNGNVYLPLANLTDFQKRALNPATSAAAVKDMTPGRFAMGMGLTTYTPALKADDPEVLGLAAMFEHQNGVQVVPETIKYLNERAQFEVSFLESLAATKIPVTLIWGVHDTISPVRVAEYVWSKYLEPRAAPAAMWLAPCANHYLQHDQPAPIAQIVRNTLAGKAMAAPLNLAGDVCSPVLAGAKN